MYPFERPAVGERRSLDIRRVWIGFYAGINNDLRPTAGQGSHYGLWIHLYCLQGRPRLSQEGITGEDSNLPWRRERRGSKDKMRTY